MWHLACILIKMLTLIMINIYIIFNILRDTFLTIHCGSFLKPLTFTSQLTYQPFILRNSFWVLYFLGFPLSFLTHYRVHEGCVHSRFSLLRTLLKTQFTITMLLSSQRESSVIFMASTMTSFGMIFKSVIIRSAKMRSPYH